jgi:hypothetical protein
MPRIVRSGLSANFPPTRPNVDGRGRSSDGGDKPACHQHLADNLGESVHLGRGQSLGLGDQVLIASRVRRRDQVNAQGRCRGAVVGRRELVDDRGDVGRGVLGCLTDSAVFAGISVLTVTVTLDAPYGYSVASGKARCTK